MLLAVLVIAVHISETILCLIGFVPLMVVAHWGAAGCLGGGGREAAALAEEDTAHLATYHPSPPRPTLPSAILSTTTPPFRSPPSYSPVYHLDTANSNPLLLPQIPPSPPSLVSPTYILAII